MYTCKVCGLAKLDSRVLSAPAPSSRDSQWRDTKIQTQSQKLINVTKNKIK